MNGYQKWSSDIQLIRRGVPVTKHVVQGRINSLLEVWDDALQKPSRQKYHAYIQLHRHFERVEVFIRSNFFPLILEKGYRIIQLMPNGKAVEYTPFGLSFNIQCYF